MADIDPLTQDMYVKGIMGLTWHKWPKGSPQSVCGLPWSYVQAAWDSRADWPAEDRCSQCDAVVNP